MNRYSTVGIVVLSLMLGGASACQSTPEPVEKSPEAKEPPQKSDASKEMEQAKDSTDRLVEIKLKDTLDEPRGYCLDIAGGRGADAPLDKGLQAHTCYDYTGGLLEDQSFDGALLSKNQFQIPYFNVCMTASASEQGATLLLEACGEKEVQQFSLEPNGNVTLKGKPELCVTVNGTERKEGRGGKPVHVMRPLSLQPCSPDQAAYQTWSTFKM